MIRSGPQKQMSGQEAGDTRYKATGVVSCICVAAKRDHLFVSCLTSWVPRSTQSGKQMNGEGESDTR